ncbi:MAG: cupin domain-containing protein [Actinomycetota bacterium]|nr:cupin domain-containing protein [Actinomycetota bacterium]
MLSLAAKSFADPDEVREFPNGRIAIVRLGDVTVGRGELQPGWRWSEDVKPIAGTDSCEVAHTGYVLSGRMHVLTDDGVEGEAGPGDAFFIAPGHDAWIVGTDPCVFLDFTGMQSYATGLQ